MRTNLSPDSSVTVVSVNAGIVIKDDLSMVEQWIKYLILDSKTKEIIWINKNYNPSFEIKKEILEKVFNWR